MLTSFVQPTYGAPGSTAGFIFYIADDETPAGAGLGTSCENPDVDYDPETGLDSALEVVYEAETFSSGDQVVLCDINSEAGAVDYVMDSDVSIDGQPTLDLSDTATPGEITISGDADDFSSIIIDADDAEVVDGYGGFSPFDITDADVTIRYLTILNAYDDSAGAAIHVLSDDAVSSLVLDTVAIEYAYASGSGAGVNVQGSVTVSDSLFEDNGTGLPPIDEDFNGAAIWASGDVQVTNTTFDGNLADGSGGAIYVESGDLEIVNSTFHNNGATTHGGAIAMLGDAFLTIVGSQFVQNYTTNREPVPSVDGPQDAGCGGAIRLDVNGDSEISNTLFDGNYAGYTGGAINTQTSCGSAAEGGTLTIQGSVFRNNVAFCAGGAIEANALIVSRSRFIDNDATDCAGGAIAAPEVQIGDSFSLTGNTFLGNSLGDGCCYGGAVYVAYQDEEFDDAVGAPVIRNNTFTRNRSEIYGGAMVLNARISLSDVRQNKFMRNSAAKGGAIVLVECSGDNFFKRSDQRALLRGNRFSQNRGGAARTRDIFTEVRTCGGGPT
jgi:predicted outer membrane repeat protein